MNKLKNAWINENNIKQNVCNDYFVYKWSHVPKIIGDQNFIILNYEWIESITESMNE